MKILFKIIITLAMTFSSLAYANKNIVDVWQCKLKEGKTMKDVASVNDKWVKFMNETVKGGGINSYDLEPRVGDHSRFLYVDVYPNMQAWAAGENAMEKSDAGKALQKELNAIAKCSSNSLYSSTKH